VILSARSGPKIAMLSPTIHVLAVAIAWCSVRSIGAPANFEQLFMLTPNDYANHHADRRP
jgi:hypothetical protein